MTRYEKDGKPDPDARAGINGLGQVITPMESVIASKDRRRLHAQAEEGERVLDEISRRRSEPVRMEGLKPLPPELRARATPKGFIPGGPDALGLVPSMRRAIPAPFQRPRIEIGHHGKTWGYARAESVREGDIVVDFGRVDEIWEQDRREDIAGHSVLTGQSLVLVNPAGRELECELEDQLRVFRVHADDAGD